MVVAGVCIAGTESIESIQLGLVIVKDRPTFRK